ncbi:hypothetical protein BGZ93_000619 [Podila epicladia]|nr:hypothetical protein BGZ92_001955 [Podila epicladia]KAG0085542.1 hypothetical protein BGZ93_000619 [Podila epicladia]
MLRYVKDGAIDFLASTLPQSLIESIRQVSEDDFLAHHVSHKQRQPRRRRPVVDSRNSAKAVVAGHRNLNDFINKQTNLVDPDTELVSGPTVQLPYEVLALVFQHLPASDLFSVLAVCRFWRQIALLETKHIDISEGFPIDCLGLGDDEYSDFDFVYNLFSIFPLVSSLVIKDRYLRDRDLRVVTAGILAGKMAFTKAGPSVESTSFLAAQKAMAAQRQRQQLHEKQDEKKTGDGSSNCDNSDHRSITSSTTATSNQPVKIMKGTIKEELRSFSDSVATYVLIPQTRNTLRKKILAQFEHNLEQKELHDTCWMLENGIDPSTTSTSSTWPTSASTDKIYPLVPMTHYRFQDCCFANDWGAHMDRNKLPMIGLAAAISGQGLYVDLEGSYGAPSRSIKTMIGFCFGQNCVISLNLNFRHTHMELEHVTELLSENPILFKIDIVDSPAYHELIRLPPLRGLGGIMERMHELCLDLDEQGLDASLQSARAVLQELASDVAAEEAAMKAQEAAGIPLVLPAPFEPSGEPTFSARGPLDDPRKPIESLTQFLKFPRGTKAPAKIRTAKILLKGMIDHGIIGLINTRDALSGQSLLHSLAWRRAYASFVTAARSSTHLPTPPPQPQDLSFPLFASSFPPSKRQLSHAGVTIATSSGEAAMTTRGFEPSPSSGSPVPMSETSNSTTPPGSQPSALSSLLALTSALSFKRLSLQPVTSLFSNPEDSNGLDGLSSSAPTAAFDHKDAHILGTTPPYLASGSLQQSLDSHDSPALVVPECHPVSISLRMAKALLDLKANPNVYNKDGRSAVMCASYMGFHPMEMLLIQNGGYSKELIRIRETM